MYSEFAIPLKLLVVLLYLGSYAQLANSSVVERPTFANNVSNVEVRKGQDAQLPCAVDNLRSYKVAWINVYMKSILTIHNIVITRNSRISVSGSGHRLYILKIANVQERDQGWYMCQVNTSPMMSSKVYLKVYGDNDTVTLSPEPELAPVNDTVTLSLEPELEPVNDTVTLSPEPELEPVNDTVTLAPEPELEPKPEHVDDTTNATSGEQGWLLRHTSSQIGITFGIVSMVVMLNEIRSRFTTI